MSDPAESELELVETACALCGCASSRFVCAIQDVTYDVPGRFVVVRCERCGHLFLNPRPSDSCLMDCYPRDYAPHEDTSLSAKPAFHLDPSSGRRVSDPDPGPACSAKETEALQAAKGPASPIRRIIRSIPGLRASLNWLGQENATWLSAPPQSGRSRLLEIGCAHGGFLERARSKGWVVDGIEPSAAAVSAARSKGLDVFCGNLLDADVGSHAREFVALWMVLEHVPNPREVVREIARILSPGGTLALSVPNAASWERHFWGRYWLGYDAPRHLQMFTAGRLKRLLRQEGFTEVRIIHQANTRYWWGSLAAWGRMRFPDSQWPKRWLKYFRTDPPGYWKWFFLLPGKLVALLRCSGRITVIARRRD